MMCMVMATSCGLIIPFSAKDLHALVVKVNLWK